MIKLSLTDMGPSNTEKDQSAEQIHESIKAFLNWIDGIEIQSNLTHRAKGIHKKIERRSASFTNGPYAEIKESIGKLLPIEKPSKLNPLIDL
jgi:hypothetical protein